MSEGPGGDVPNHMGSAVLTTIFACTPFGLVAMAYAAKVNAHLQAGDRAAAIVASNKARSWAWVASITGAVAYLICFVALYAMIPRLIEQLRSLSRG